LDEPTTGLDPINRI